MVTNTTSAARSTSPSSSPSSLRSSITTNLSMADESYRFKPLNHTGKFLIFKRVEGDFTAPKGISWKSVTPEALTVSKLAMLELQQEPVADLDNHLIFCVWKHLKEDRTVRNWGIHGFFRPLYIPDEGKTCSCWSDRIFVILSKEQEKDVDVDA